MFVMDLLEIQGCNDNSQCVIVEHVSPLVSAMSV